MSRFVVTGTDTDVGKTVFSAALVRAIGASYWKPVQAGLEPSSDCGTVSRLDVPAGRILPEAYRLTTPCSPHRAAELDGIEIDINALLQIPQVTPLVIEGAGGALVPVTREVLYADLFAKWDMPVIIVARTSLGTINHSLLTVEALKARAIPIHGIAFVGDEHADSEATIIALSGVKRLGRLPVLPDLTAEALDTAFRKNFRLEDFQ